MQKSLRCFYCGLALFLCAGTGWARPFPEADARPPEYSRLFDRVEVLERSGRPLEALRLIPDIYRQEIPVDAFHGSLERKKRALVGALKRQESIPIGEDCCTMSDIRQMFQALLGRPETLYQEAPASIAPPLELFLYTLAVVQPAAAGPAGGPPSYDALAEAAIQSLDPWLTTTGIFLARKGNIGNKGQKILLRWQVRPDLWEDTTQVQALLFLARLTTSQLEELPVENQEIRLALENLKPVTAAGCRVQPLLRNLAGEPLANASSLHRYILWSEYTVIATGPPANGSSRASHWLEMRSEQPLTRPELPAIDGWYRLRVVAPNFHGQSSHFQCRPNTRVRVPIGLYPNL